MNRTVTAFMGLPLRMARCCTPLMHGMNKLSSSATLLLTASQWDFA